MTTYQEINHTFETTDFDIAAYFIFTGKKVNYVDFKTNSNDKKIKMVFSDVSVQEKDSFMKAWAEETLKIEPKQYALTIRSVRDAVINLLKR